MWLIKKSTAYGFRRLARYFFKVDSAGSKCVRRKVGKYPVDTSSEKGHVFCCWIPLVDTCQVFRLVAEGEYMNEQIGLVSVADQVGWLEGVDLVQAGVGR